MNIKRLSVSSLLILVVLMAGCAPSVKMAPADRQATKSIFIDEEVAYPEKMHFSGPAQSISMNFGLIGWTIAEESAKKPSEKFSAYARQNGIFIEEIVRDEFVEQFNTSGKFAQAGVKEQADAVMTLKVDNYGIYNGGGISKNFTPVLLMHATLINKVGKTIWEETAYANLLEKGGYTLEQYKQNPDLIRQGWSETAKKAMAALMEKL